MRRANGRSDRWSATRSSRLAWRKSTSSGSGRRTDRATACGPLGDQAPAHLGLDLLPQALPGGQHVVTLHPTGAGQQAGQGAVHIKHAHRLEDVRAPAHPPPLLHAGEPGDGQAGQPLHRLGVARAQRLVQQGGQVLAPVVDRGGRQGKVGVEDGVERRPVLRPLHHGGGHGRPQDAPIVERHMAHRLHGVDVLGQRHRQPGRPQLADEACEQVQH